LSSYRKYIKASSILKGIITHVLRVHRYGTSEQLVYLESTRSGRYFSKLSRAEAFRIISTMTALKKSDRIAINIIRTIVERYVEDS